VEGEGNHHIVDPLTERKAHAAMTERNERSIAGEILSYLVAQPTAKDTLEGIAEWWLLKSEVVDAIDTVSLALERLVSEGLLKPVSYQGEKKKYYEINTERLEEIKKLLDELEAGGR
jgi:hypothetical protein